jgi:hypothetical protein
MSDPWYARIAREAQELEEAAIEREHGIPEPSDPPEDGTCRTCHEWRYYPKGQRHFGQTWWRVCSLSCDHECHEREFGAVLA